MDLSNPYILISGLIIGLIGFGLILHGKRAKEPKCMGLGLAMCVYPYFVPSLLLMWALACACLAAAYFLPRSG